MIQIAVMNESTVMSDAEVQAMIPALRKQWNGHLVAVWGVETSGFTFFPKPQMPPASSWWCVFLDNSDQAGALAYHDLTNEGLPIAKIFAKTLQDDSASISVGASHELCEMAVDPWLNSAYQDPQGNFWAGEVCDPVEDGLYGYTINGALVSDFITPAWFGHQHAAGPFDYKGHLNASFQILSGGYAQEFQPGRGWVQVNGMDLHGHQLHAPIGSRRERRTRLVSGLQRSEVTR